MIVLEERHLQAVKKILSEYLPDYEVRAFGSRVGDGTNTKKFSDLDLVVVSEKPAPSNKIRRTKEAFSESDLPFRVDLVDWSRLERNFRNIISSKYEVLQMPNKKQGIASAFESHVQQYADNILKVIDAYPEILFCSLYGSIVKNKLTPNSDIDIAVAGTSPIPLETLADISIKLSDACHREVDLVDINTKTGLLLQQVLCEGKVILKKSLELYARLIRKMWYDQADMMPYTRMIWETRRRKRMTIS